MAAAAGYQQMLQACAVASAQVTSFLLTRDSASKRRRRKKRYSNRYGLFEYNLNAPRVRPPHALQFEDHVARIERNPQRGYCRLLTSIEEWNFKVVANHLTPFIHWHEAQALQALAR